jgi:hypothetical protein
MPPGPTRGSVDGPGTDIGAGGSGAGGGCCGLVGMGSSHTRPVRVIINAATTRPTTRIPSAHRRRLVLLLTRSERYPPPSAEQFPCGYIRSEQSAIEGQNAHRSPIEAGLIGDLGQKLRLGNVQRRVQELVVCRLGLMHVEHARPRLGWDARSWRAKAWESQFRHKARSFIGLNTISVSNGEAPRDDVRRWLARHRIRR